MTWRSRHLAWRRNWWLIATLAGFTVAMLVLMGTDVVVPYTSSKSLAAQTQADGSAKRKTIAAARGLPGENITNTVDVFDDSIVHRVSIAMSPFVYDSMITDYQRAGEKSWHPATVEIDGVRVHRVGVRLKGNSTLIGLRYSGPDSPPAPGIVASLGTLTADDPQKMPFLFRFDEFVPGQRYQGLNELALRTAGGFGGDSTHLTELIANRLTEESGLPFLRSATSGVSVNGSSEGFYLLVEHPDDYWARRIVPGTQQPALYKAIPGASFHYVGAEPALYVNVFNQQAETLDIGPAPMIDFLQFVEESTDEDFEAHLADHLDVEEFARYLAFHNVVVDPDSLAGTGNNYYLLYDPKSRRMSFASWDQNLAFGRLGFGGGPYRPYYEDGSGIPGGLANLPGLEELVPGSALGETNVLVARFLESPTFRALYDRTYRAFFEQILASGRAEALLDELAPAIRAANDERNLVDPARFESDVERNRTFMADRIAYLQTVAPVAGRRRAYAAAPMTAPPIPVDVDDVTPEWLRAVLGVRVTGVEVLDRHSGTTGRARVGVTYGAGDDGAFPPTLFVKLPPFDEQQRKFVDMAGLGVAEARFYRDLAHEITLRIPAVHHAAVDDDGRYVMVIEDLAAIGCRFPRPGDDDVGEWGGGLVEELARLHAPYWDSPRLQHGGDLVWVTDGGRTGRNVPKGSGGGYIGLALEQFGDEMGSAFRRLAQLYMEHAPVIMENVLDEGTPTLIHGDPHLGNLFIDGDRVGFLDWAMLDRRTGMRDVSYVLCNSIPAEIRRAHEKEWVAHYLATLAEGGVVLDADTAWEQYRLYAVYSWVSATSTAAVGNRWQAAKIGQGGMRRATASIEDLDTVTILEDRLGV